MFKLLKSMDLVILNIKTGTHFECLSQSFVFAFSNSTLLLNHRRILCINFFAQLIDGGLPGLSVLVELV